MLRIKRETDFGLLFLEELSDLESGKYLSLQSWAAKRRLPYRFLSKVAGSLKRTGFVMSKEGKDGGYRLAKRSSRVKLGQVIKALEGSIALSRCSAGVKCSFQPYCRHKILLGRLGRLIEDKLNRISLQSLYVGSH